MVEYHGWVTLCCRNEEWGDDDWDVALLEIGREIARFSPRDGHSITFAQATNSRRALQLSGYTSERIDTVLRLMKSVGRLIPDSYGELVVMEDDHPDLATASRYRMARGRVARV